MKKYNKSRSEIYRQEVKVLDAELLYFLGKVRDAAWPMLKSSHLTFLMFMVPQRKSSLQFRGQTSNSTQVNYPASCVKLAYMTHAIATCQAKGSSPMCFDAHVRPMVVYRYVCANFSKLKLSLVTILKLVW